MRTRALARPLPAAVCVLMGLVMATACSGASPSDEADSPASSSTPAEPSSETASETATPETATPTETPQQATPTTEPDLRPTGKGLPGRLLSARQLPGFNDAYRWTQGATAPENPSGSFGTCQRFAVASIGAEQALVRRFRPAVADPTARFDRAGELVAQFPDEMTARRAFAVLKAWRAQCADRLASRTRARVGPLEAVRVDGGSGGWYLLTYGPVRGDRNAQFFDAQGMAVVGSRVAMVSMVLAGQDYNYEPGEEPMVTAVQRAARLLTNR